MKVPDGTPCPHCGYELTGLDRHGLCPECGSALELALKPDNLVYSSPVYVAKLHTGAFLVVIAMVVTIVMVLLTILRAVSGFWMDETFGALGTLVWFAIGVLSLTGWWLLSSPDPAMTGVRQGATSRVFLRGLLVLQVGAALFNLVIELTVMAYASGLAPLVMGLIEQIVSYAAFITSMLYLRVLARRMPSQYIAENAKALFALGLVLFALAIVLFAGTVISVSTGGGTGRGGALLILLMIPLAIVAVVFLGLYYYLLDRTRRTLKEVRGRQ
jgi:hypothetical protein